ncbi:MAG TPA: 23S rRNA (uracil(1939)-C(5))-methyltransferase RlmD [Succinivibrionaceae bacterium]|nr:23S rRNA (uracil(1939)-C(5))-methyltransferase RlmD [Succinivibrionaceae bacterium]
MTDKHKVSEVPDCIQDEDQIVAEIAALSEKGEGIFEYKGDEIYVKNTVPQDVVRVKLHPPFVKGSRRRPGEIIEMINSSPKRALQEEICIHQDLCGGCPLGLLNVKSQIEYKQHLITKALDKAGICGFGKPAFTGSVQKNCRHKSIRFFKGCGDDLCQGFYQSRSHELCRVVNCPLEPAWFGKLAEEVCQKARETGVNAYDEFSAQGCLRTLTMRDCGLEERLAVLSYNDPLPKDFVEKIAELFQEYQVKAGFIQRNQTRGNRIMTGELKPLTKDLAIRAELCGFEFEAGPYTFLQVNPVVAQKMYEAALAWCGQDPKREALDLCCGCGTMTLMLAKRFKKVTGVEIVNEAVKAAYGNAAKAGITNAEFIAADLQKVLPDLSRKDLAAVIADPPRSGLGSANCRALKSLHKGVKLAVIFCGLKALSRDLKDLADAGFMLKAVRGFDMFPKAMGCETLCMLEKQ